MSENFDKEKARKLRREFLNRHLEWSQITREQFRKLSPQSEYPVEMLPPETERPHLFRPFIDLRINLNFSQKEILNEVESHVQQFKDYYKEYFEEEMRDYAWSEFRYPHGSNESDAYVRRRWKERRNPHYERRVRDSSLEQYEIQLKVWDLREKEKKSFGEISKIIDSINSAAMARDYYKAAQKNIKLGPPFGQPFEIY
jgi:hypothetical protein